MKRALAAMLLLIAACAMEPPERSALPDVSAVLEEPKGCQLLVGDPLGVLVDDVVTGSAAFGLLANGDIITSIDGVATVDAATLIGLMADKAPGDSIEVTFRRGDQEQMTALILGESPDDATRPQIGIMIQTAFEKIPFREANDEVTPSTTARPMALGGHILLFDPATGDWLHTDTTVTSNAWVGTTQGLYGISGADSESIVDLASGLPVETDGFQDWQPRRLIGALGPQLILMVTSEIPDQPGFVNVAVALFDPVEGVTRWVTPVLEGFGLPVLAFGSPDQSAFILVGADQETGEALGVEFYDSQGTLRATGDLIDLGTPVGWFDGTSMAFRSSQDLVSVYSFADGSTQNYTLPGGLVDSFIAAVGDGRHVLAISSRDLVINDVVAGSEVRTLAENCSVDRIGEQGWGL